MNPVKKPVAAKPKPHGGLAEILRSGKAPGAKVVPPAVKPGLK